MKQLIEFHFGWPEYAMFAVYAIAIVAVILGERRCNREVSEAYTKFFRNTRGENEI